MESNRFCPQCRAKVTLHHPKGRNVKCTFCFEETDEGMTWYACTSRTERHYMCSPCLERSIRATNNDTRRITKNGDTAGMCPKCYYGPLDVYNNCGDLRAHHLDRVRDCYGPRDRRNITSNTSVYSGWVLNSCPQCCFYSTKPEDWVPWDCKERASNVDVRNTLVHVKFGSQENEEGSEPHQYLQEYGSLHHTPVRNPYLHSGLFSSLLAQLPGVTPHGLARLRETIRNVNSADQSAGIRQSAQSERWGHSAQSERWGHSAQSAVLRQSAQSERWGHSAQSERWGRSAQSAVLRQSAQSERWGHSAQSAELRQSAQSERWSRSAQSVGWGDLFEEIERPGQSARSGELFQEIELDHPILHSYTRHLCQPLHPHRAKIFRIMIAAREYDEIDVAWVLHADHVDTIDETRASLQRRRSVPLPPPPPSRSPLISQHEGTHLRRNLIQAKCYFFAVVSTTMSQCEQRYLMLRYSVPSPSVVAVTIALPIQGTQWLWCGPSGTLSATMTAVDCSTGTESPFTVESGCLDPEVCASSEFQPIQDTLIFGHWKVKMPFIDNSEVWNEETRQGATDLTMQPDGFHYFSKHAALPAGVRVPILTVPLLLSTETAAMIDEQEQEARQNIMTEAFQTLVATMTAVCVEQENVSRRASLEQFYEWQGYIQQAMFQLNYHYLTFQRNTDEYGEFRPSQSSVDLLHTYRSAEQIVMTQIVITE